jgi:hypothetical protein
MATNDPATNEIETAHTGQEDDNRDTQAPDAATHLREILIRLEGGMVFPDCDSMVVDSDEEGEQTAILAERITPLETCYRDITDLGTLLLNSLCKDLLEADLQELLVAAMTCDNKLKAIKQEEKAEHRDRYQATSAQYSTMYYSLNSSITKINQLLAKLRRKAKEASAAPVLPAPGQPPTGAQPPRPIQVQQQQGGTTTTVATTTTTTTRADIQARVDAMPSSMATQQQRDRQALLSSLRNLQEGSLVDRVAQMTPFDRPRGVHFGDPGASSTPRRPPTNPDTGTERRETSDIEEQLRSLQTQLHNLSDSIQNLEENQSGDGYGYGGGGRGGSYSRGRGGPFSHSRGGATTNTVYTKMPSMKLTNFKGDYEHFPVFQQEFKTLYQKEGMENKDLAMRLYNHLEGEPKKKVQDLYRYNLDSGCYGRMWTELEKLYGGPAVETASIIKEIYLQKSLNTEDAQEITSFYDFLVSQYSYWAKDSAESVTSPRNGIHHLIKLKLSAEMERKYKRWITKMKTSDNMQSMFDWISEIYSENVDSTKTKATRDLSSEIASLKGKSFRGQYTAPRGQQRGNFRFAPKKTTPVVMQADFDLQGGEEQPSEEDQGNSFYWQGDEIPPDDEQPFDPEEEVIQITKAEMRAFFKKAKEGTPPLNCQQCQQGTHKLENCQIFKELSLTKRNAYVRDQGICFHCLDGQHRVKDCLFKQGVKCGKDGCDRYHHPLLHSTVTAKLISHAQFPEEELLEDLNASCYRTKKGTSNMQTLTVLVEGGTSRKAVVMLDSGANVCCIDEDFAKEIGATEIVAPSTHTLDYLDRTVTMRSGVVRISISSLTGFEKTYLEAWTVKNLTMDIHATDWNEEKGKWPHLKDLTFPMLPEDPRVYVLIGNNYPGCFVPEKIVKGSSFHDPLGYLTPFGWTVLGGTKKKYELLERKTQEELKTSHRLSFFTKIRSFFE